MKDDVDWIGSTWGRMTQFVRRSVIFFTTIENLPFGRPIVY